MAEFPRVVVAGSPSQRGEQYGECARDRVRTAMGRYAEAFAGIAGLDWEGARARAASFVPAIEAHDVRHLDELRGIARGAGVGLLDVLALNIRTEIIFPARVRAAGLKGPSECTTLAVTRGRTTSGTTLVAENWEYLAGVQDSVVLLEAHPDDGVSFITLVEAGQLGKMGMNAAGLAVATNGLATQLDVGAVGVPYHILLRRLLECASVEEAVTSIERVPRASSGNYLLGSADGIVVNVEAWASGERSVCQLLTPRDGVLVHTNHVLAAPADCYDLPFHLSDTSTSRRARAEGILRAGASKVGVDDVKRALSDHQHHPLGVCTHHDLSVPELERYPTLASLIMEPETRRILLADGNPCEAPWRELDTAAIADCSA